MRALITIVSFSICLASKSQISDSFQTERYQRFLVDTGKYLPAMIFVDVDGNKKTLADYEGKILYVSLWATTCRSSIEIFPYQEQLIKRLRDINIDSSIQFINIHLEDSKKQWHQSLRKYHPIGVNLYCSDTSLLSIWNLTGPPAYLILDRAGKILGKNISQPTEAGEIDYILYCGTKGIFPAQAMTKHYEQGKIMAQYKSSSAITDYEYKNWFDLTIASFINFQKWRKERNKRNSR